MRLQPGNPKGGCVPPSGAGRRARALRRWRGACGDVSGRRPSHLARLQPPGPAQPLGLRPTFGAGCEEACPSWRTSRWGPRVECEAPRSQGCQASGVRGGAMGGAARDGAGQLARDGVGRGAGRRRWGGARGGAAGRRRSAPVLVCSLLHGACAVRALT